MSEVDAFGRLAPSALSKEGLLARATYRRAVEGEGSFAIPKKLIPKKLRGLSRFVVTRDGEYCFMPSLTGLKWVAAWLEGRGDGRANL